MSDHPILYYKGKGGALYQWRVWAEGDQVFTEYGQVGGKQQRTPGKRCAGTNAGRANEQTPEQHAAATAKSMWTFKVERKYREKPEEAEQELFLPMLATAIEKVKKVPYPVHCQGKFDGCRCLAYWENGAVQLMSRSGKPYAVPHIQAALAQVLPTDAIFDGELYRHGLPLQTITSLIKRPQERQRELQYWVYDMPQVAGDNTLPWVERHQALLATLVHRKGDDKGFPDLDFPLVYADTVECRNFDEVKLREQYFVENGYEGAMVRLLDGRYEWGRRSRDLLKVKSFVDCEVEIVGAREGQGKMAGCVVWLCKNDTTDATFECSMACSMAERAQYWRDRDQYIGRKLTVKFFDRTVDGLPRFPVGKAIRCDEDLGAA